MHYYTLQKNGFTEFDGYDLDEVIREAQSYCNEYWIVGDDIQAMEYELVEYYNDNDTGEICRSDVSFYPDWHDEPSDFDEHNILNKTMTGVK